MSRRIPALTVRNGRYSVPVGGVALEAPATITGLHSWWRGDYGITLTGGAISSWADKVSGRTVSQSTAAARPAETTRAALNSQAAILFDGSNDYLRSDDAASTWKFLHDGTGYTAVAIWEQIYSGAAMQPIVSTTLAVPTTTQIGAALAAYYGVTTGFMIQLTANGTGRVLNQQPGSLAVTAAAHWGEWFFDDANTPDAGIYLDNSLKVSGAKLLTPSSSDPDASLTFGGLTTSGSYAGIALAEVIIYTGVLSADDRSSLATYFDTRYGTAW